jgi:twinkle protein
MSQTHKPCDIDGGCGSSDAMTVNDDGSRKCYSCGSFAPSTGNRRIVTDTKKPKQFQAVTQQPTSIPDRGINLLAAQKYGIVTIGNETHFPYYDKEGKLVAYKVRRPDKTMYSKGDIKSATMFGQQLFPKKGKTVTIVEGEFDAPSSWDMQGSKYPVISIKNGASGALKDCQDNFEYINSFEKVYVNFDNDEVGQKAAKEVCELFSDKAVNVKLQQHKDANDYLVAGKRDAYRNEWWRGEEYRPDGIVTCTDMYDLLMQPIQMPFARYPFDGMNLMSYAIREGEIVTILAGSGVGKTTITKEIIKQIYDDTDVSIGVLSLEESLGGAGLSMLSLRSNKRFNLPTKQQMVDNCLLDPSRIVEKPYLDDVTDEQRAKDKHEAYQQIYGEPRFHFLEHKGNLTIEAVTGQLRYLAKALGCKVLVLDHISILVGYLSTGKMNEREAIDDTMHHLRRLVEETGITIFNVCHLRKPSDGVGHDEGRQVRAVEARGSGAIIQLSDIAWALEGNRQAEDVQERNITTIRGLKMRIGGGGGIACKLRYNEETGRLSEILDHLVVAGEDVI